MRIKRIFSIMVCAICLFLAVSCGLNQGNPLVGEWYGQVESQSSSDKGKMIDVYLTINSDGTWISVEDGERKNGKWTSSGGMLALTNTGSDGEEDDNGWYFGQKDGKIIFGFNDWYHYDAEMSKVEAAPISANDLIGEWSGQVESQSSKGKTIDVYLTINSDGTWISVEDGERKNGKWTSSGGMFALTNTGSDGEEDDNGWYFGRLNGKFIFGFNDWNHYDAEMSKVEAAPISANDLIGEWSGQVESQSSKGKTIDVYLTINSDGTWISVEDGERKNGKWTSSGGMFALTNTGSDGEEDDNGWYFGRLNGKFIFGFNDWNHYDAEMSKVETAPISANDLIGEWSGQVESQSSKGKMIDVYLTINSDGTWISVENGKQRNGNWKDSGSMFPLTNIGSDGEEDDNGWYFGRLNGKFIFGFNDWNHYDVEMTKK